MAKKIKVSQLDEATALAGLWILGVDETNRSVKAAMQLLRGLDGKSVELQRTATAIQWRREGGTWVNLMTVADIQKPATDAAASLNAFVQEATATLSDLQADTEAAGQGAIAAAAAAGSAAAGANAAGQGAMTAATAANEAAGNAAGAAGEASAAASAANSAKESAVLAAEQAAAATGTAIAAASAASDAAGIATAAAETAQTLNASQPRITDGFWWVYDLTAGGYVNTDLPARGLTGKPLIVLSNGNYGNWNDETQEYEDSGMLASASIDLDNLPVDFAGAENVENIETGETVPAIFGKIAKWFTSLGSLAWKSKVDYNNDIDNKPAIPDAQIQTDWNQTTASAKDYLKNKPALFSGAFSALSGTPTTLSGYGISDAYTKNEVDAKTTAIYRPKGSVDTYSDLPGESGNETGDVYNVLDSGHNYAWVGISGNHSDGWDQLAGNVDLSSYLTQDVANTRYSFKPVFKTATLTVNGWEGNDTDGYTKTITDAGITDGSFIEYAASQDTEDIAGDAGFYSFYTGEAGSFTLRARSLPAGNITLNYVIL